MKCLINNVEVVVQNGETVISTLDETLDNGTLDLCLCNLENSIKPDSKVSIIDDQNNKYLFVVVKDEVKLASKNPLSYIHNIAFTQNTRVLSKPQLRNTVFSQPAKPKIDIKYAQTFKNVPTADNMSAYASFYQEAKQLFNKQKVNLAYITFEIDKWIINTYTTTRPTATKKNFVIRQGTSTLSRISFDLLKDGIIYRSYSYTNVNNGSKLYLPIASFQGGSTYSIANVVIASNSTDESVSDNDRFSVRISLSLETYYYSLYDILYITNEQMKLNEIDETSSVLAPTIEIKKEYVSSSSGYAVYFRIKNNNAITSSVSYSATGSFTASGVIELAANTYSGYILLGLGAAYENGVVTAFSYNSNGISEEVSEIWSISTAILPPSLSWETSSTYGDKWVLTNTNAYTITAYYKFWKEGLDELSYTSVVLTSGQVIKGDGYYKNCRCYYKTYATNDKGQTSAVDSGVRVCGTLPKLTSPRINSVVVLTGSTTYVIKVGVTNPNSVSVNVLMKINNNYFLNVGTLAANSSGEFKGNELQSYGTSGTLNVYFTADNYIDSDETSSPWVFGYYRLTVYYYKDGVIDSTLTAGYDIYPETTVYPSDYIIPIDGYIYQDSVPADSFTMTGATSIQMNYVIGTSTNILSVGAEGGVTEVEVGKTLQLYGYNETTDPNHTTPLTGVTFTSSNSAIISIDSNGLATGVSRGNIIVTAAKTDYTLSSKTYYLASDYFYDLILNYYKNGSIDSSLTNSYHLRSDTSINPDTYKETLTDYTFINSSPSAKFTLTQTTTIKYYYGSTYYLTEYFYETGTTTSIYATQTIPCVYGDIVNPVSDIKTIDHYLYAQTVMTDAQVTNSDITGNTSITIDSTTRFIYYYGYTMADGSLSGVYDSKTTNDITALFNGEINIDNYSKVHIRVSFDSTYVESKSTQLTHTSVVGTLTKFTISNLIATINGSTGATSGFGGGNFSTSGGTLYIFDNEGGSIGGITYSMTEKPTLTKPTLFQVDNNTTSCIVRFRNTNSVAVNLSGSYVGDDGVSTSIDYPNIGDGSAYDLTINWASGISFYDISCYFRANGYYDSAVATMTITLPTQTVDTTTCVGNVVAESNGDGTYRGKLTIINNSKGTIKATITNVDLQQETIPWATDQKTILPGATGTWYSSQDIDGGFIDYNFDATLIDEKGTGYNLNYTN